MDFKGFKASKTLSGIETLQTCLSYMIAAASKPLKPFQGLKLILLPRIFRPKRCFKASKTLSGIETIGITKFISEIVAKLQSL